MPRRRFTRADAERGIAGYRALLGKPPAPPRLVRDGDEWYCTGCRRRWPVGEDHP